jgi:hypothetical protein
MILRVENSDGICDIGPSGSHHVDQTCGRQLVYGRITGFFIGLPLVQLHCHWCGNCPGLVHSELQEHHPNVAVMMNVDRVILSIAFDGPATKEGDTSFMMHPESRPHVMLDLPNQALSSNGQEIIEEQDDCGNEYVLIRVMEHEQSSLDT